MEGILSNSAAICAIHFSDPCPPLSLSSSDDCGSQVGEALRGQGDTQGPSLLLLLSASRLPAPAPPPAPGGRTICALASVAQPSCPQALMSELKILAHLGTHRNIVNMLGAVTTRLNISMYQINNHLLSRHAKHRSWYGHIPVK